MTRAQLVRQSVETLVQDAAHILFVILAMLWLLGQYGRITFLPQGVPFLQAVGIGGLVAISTLAIMELGSIMSEGIMGGYSGQWTTYRRTLLGIATAATWALNVWALNRDSRHELPQAVAALLASCLVLTIWASLSNSAAPTIRRRIGQADAFPPVRR